MSKKDYLLWLRKYRAAFADEVHVSEQEAALIIDLDMAESDYRKGAAPERAGRAAARFAFFGE